MPGSLDQFRIEKINIMTKTVKYSGITSGYLLFFYIYICCTTEAQPSKEISERCWFPCKN